MEPVGKEGLPEFIPENIFYKLCFKASNETARKFQDIVTGEILPAIRKTGTYSIEQTDVSQLSPELQMFNHLFAAQARNEMESKRQAEKINRLEEKTAEVEQTLTIIQSTLLPRDEDWRTYLNDIFNNVVENSASKDYQKARNYTYMILEERAHCDLAVRLKNLKQRLYDSGATKTTVEKANKLDCIESEPRLKEIYSMIVRELAIKYTVYKKHYEFAGNLADGG